MNTFKIRYAMPLVLCAAAALSACGGGQGDDEGINIPVDKAQTASLLEICDRPQLPALQGADNGVDYSAMPATTILHDVASLAAAGHDFDGEASYELRATLNDFRPRQPVPGYVFLPNEPTNSSISVRLWGGLGDQAVACVHKLSYPSFRNPVNLGNGLVLLVKWEDTAGIDVVLPSAGTALDGFELLSNFEPRGGSITYRVPKSMAADGRALSECFQPSRPSASRAWSCRTPQLADGGDQWLLTLPDAKAGRYVLVSSRAQIGS